MATARIQSKAGSTTHVDVVIVGAGISGIGSAYHLQQQCPNKTYAILEMKDTFGGTWETHKYPGVRSDSDLYTFGYRFKPWVGTPIASADEILKYMGEVIEENGIGRHIRYGHRITRCSWSSKDQSVDRRRGPQLRRRNRDVHLQLPVDVPGLLRSRKALRARLAGHRPVTRASSCTPSFGIRRSTTPANACW